MRETIRDKARLEHMLEAAMILKEKASTHTIQDIKDEPILFYGLAKLIEIIGEAAYKLSNEFKNNHPELPWKEIQGMRHILVHEYYSMSPEKILATISEDIPQIIPILKTYLQII